VRPASSCFTIKFVVEAVLAKIQGLIAAVTISGGAP
jgi:hypothetical protein